MAGQPWLLGLSCPITDQRGHARSDLACDSGAYELKYTDSDTARHSIGVGNTYAFGPALAKARVVNAGTCASLSILRVAGSHPQALFISSNCCSRSTNSICAQVFCPVHTS